VIENFDLTERPRQVRGLFHDGPATPEAAKFRKQAMSLPQFGQV
jgi:hypothetical protein